MAVIQYIALVYVNSLEKAKYGSIACLNLLPNMNSSPNGCTSYTKCVGENCSNECMI